MSRTKKSRKPGPIGPQKAPKKPNAVKQTEVTRAKKRKGHKPGSRHSSVEIQPEVKNVKHLDKRIGSKRPIELVIQDKAEVDLRRDLEPQVKLQKAISALPKVEKVASEPAMKQSLSPEQELEEIENDPQLNLILDKLDDGDTLSDDEQDYFDQMTGRHNELLTAIEQASAPVAKSNQDTDDESDDAILDRFDETKF